METVERFLPSFFSHLYRSVNPTDGWSMKINHNIREFSFHWEARINWLRTEHYPISPRDSYSKWCKFWQKSALVEQNGFGGGRIWKNMKQYHSEINLTSPYGDWSRSTPVTLWGRISCIDRDSTFPVIMWYDIVVLFHCHDIHSLSFFMIVPHLMMILSFLVYHRRVVIVVTDFVI